METHPLRVWRKTNQITLEQLSSAVGVTRATLSRIERYRHLPSFGLVVRVIDETGGKLTADDFVPLSSRADSVLQEAAE